MKWVWLVVAGLIPVVLTGCHNNNSNTPSATASAAPEIFTLPAPQLAGTVSLEESLNERRSVREYSDEPLSLSVVAQLLWAAQGITNVNGYRTAPSAGGLYPLEIYLVAGRVEHLPAGIFRYVPKEHNLILINRGDYRQELSSASLDQKSVEDGAIDLVISAVNERTTQKYGERGIRYVAIETGHASQNVLLQAVVLGLGAVPIGAFDDSRVKKLLMIPEEETPLYVIPVGRPLSQ
jgi:SagB-type dehydrogenase family enzyme